MDRNLERLFQSLNLNCNYLVLRGWESFIDKDTFDLAGDIDILCDNKVKFVDILGAKPIHINSHRANYYVNCGNKKIQFDIRYLGDNYYCKSWQESMLQTKIKVDNIYVLDKVNYYYSLIYHILVHKKVFKDKYKHKLQELGDNNDVFVFEKESLFLQLSEWMTENTYSFEIPEDYAVDVNWSLLSENITKPIIWHKWASKLLKKRDGLLEILFKNQV